ncbi:MAG: hypothetical protein HOY44_04630 [Maritimibacter sp.]|uniref:hypothetical protein n=1 Tax=Maritimibacter sp. TaxID=2003363 RepID=UPI001D6C53EE|nr:hypothetical protein [Maritimibacter sp.]MBL6426791.1 hypothetical protein [Maritimibacter sp.]
MASRRWPRVLRRDSPAAEGPTRRAKSKRPALNEERLKDIILDEAYRDITVRDGAAVNSSDGAGDRACDGGQRGKGQHWAQRLFAEMLAATERQNKALADEWLETAITYKVEWDQELARREQLGITDLPRPCRIRIR